MTRSPGLTLLLTVVAFWAGAGLPMLVAQMPPREAHAFATGLLAMGLGAALPRLLPKELAEPIGRDWLLWCAAVFTVSLVSSTFTTALVWATLRGL